MYLIVGNIPEEFRSCDLRNYFSEFIEKEAFNCFHFRHRPQSQLASIVKNATTAVLRSQAHVGPGNIEITQNIDNSAQENCNDDVLPQHTRLKYGHEDNPYEANVGNIEKTNITHKLEGDGVNDKNNAGNNKRERTISLTVDNILSRTENKETTTVQRNHNVGGTSEASELKTDNNTESKRAETWQITSNDTKEAGDGNDHGSDGSKAHWLSYGLVGLASLISEKKKQVMPSPHWSQNLDTANKEGLGIRKPRKAEPKETSSTASDIKKNAVCRGASSSSSFPLTEVLSQLLQEEVASRRTCCVIDIKAQLWEKFLHKYDRKHWVTRSGDILPQRCHVLRVEFGSLCKGIVKESYQTRQERSALSLAPGCPKDLIEFRPPPLMPEGNIGTPTKHFRELIRTCQMPGTLIKKLGLEFPRGRGKRRFGQVPFDYGTQVAEGEEDGTGQEQMERDIAFTASGHLIPSSAHFEEEQKRRKQNRKGRLRVPKGPRMELEEEAEDGAEVEEWERYEPFHEDVTSQDRIKERRFEEELEVVWEKGGSGLVFYTDAQFWRAQQGDFDEQTADEWDVDMSVYYEEGAGDKDARDGVDMITSDKLRTGRVKQSVFKRKGEGRETLTGKMKRRIGPAPPPTIGRFEAHTKGIGRRLLEAQGWREGQGLGAEACGMPFALENDGQHPHDRKGFGYHGEKLPGWTTTTTSSTTSMQKKQPHRHHRISTVFDRVQDADPTPPPLRTSEPTKLSHRTQPH